MAMPGSYPRAAGHKSGGEWRRWPWPRPLTGTAIGSTPAAGWPGRWSPTATVPWWCSACRVGGVVVAAPVAAAFGAEFGVLVVRKLGAPRREELAMGAVAEGGVR